MILAVKVILSRPVKTLNEMQEKIMLKADRNATAPVNIPYVRAVGEAGDQWREFLSICAEIARQARVAYAPVFEEIERKQRWLHRRKAEMDRFTATLAALDPEKAGAN
jgi:hypothetical protein